MATHSSTLAWKIPWTEEPCRLQSMGSQSRTRLSDFTFTFHLHALEEEMATHSSVLAWRIPGMAGLGGLPTMGSHRVGHDWSDLAAAAAAKNHCKSNVISVPNQLVPKKVDSPQLWNEGRSNTILTLLISLSLPNGSSFLWLVKWLFSLPET